MTGSSENRVLEQVGAAGGIAFVLLQLVSQALLSVGGAEPRFDAGSEKIAQFFADRDSELVWPGPYLATLAFVPFLWFVGTVWSALHRAEEDPAWLSLVALGSGLVAVAIGLVAVLFWPIAVFRVDEGLDPEIGRLIFDLGNYAFVTFWVVIAGFVLAVGLATLRTRALPRWLGWASIVLAVGLLAARVAWTSQASFTPYVLFWIWLFVAGVILIRRARRGGATSAG